MAEPIFLTVEQVIELHQAVIDRFGGAHGLKDPGLLESAVMAPQQTFGGEFLYKSLAEMGAAYWICIVGNHPFIDGNKRAGLIAFDTFMLINNVKLEATSEEVVDITLSIATGSFDREKIVGFVEERSRTWK